MQILHIFLHFVAYNSSISHEFTFFIECLKSEQNSYSGILRNSVFHKSEDSFRKSSRTDVISRFLGSVSLGNAAIKTLDLEIIYRKMLFGSKEIQ